MRLVKVDHAYFTVVLSAIILPPLSPLEVLKLPIIAQLQKGSPWNVPLSGVKGGGGGGSVVRVGSGRSPFISRLQTPQSGVSHFAQVGYLTVVLFYNLPLLTPFLDSTAHAYTRMILQINYQMCNKNGFTMLYWTIAINTGVYSVRLTSVSLVQLTSRE